MENNLKSIFGEDYKEEMYELPYFGVSEKHKIVLKSLLKTFKLASVAVEAGQHILIKAGSGKSALTELLSHAFERKLIALALSSSSDANDLIGSYEQTSQDRSYELKLIKQNLIDSKKYKEALEMATLSFNELKQRYKLQDSESNSSKLMFSWFFSPLIEAYQKGGFVLLDNI